MKTISVPTGVMLAVAAMSQIPLDGFDTAHHEVLGVSEAEGIASPASGNVSYQEVVAVAGPGLAVTTVTEEWTKAQERRFLALAEKEALGKLGALEKTELEELSQERNTL